MNSILKVKITFCFLLISLAVRSQEIVSVRDLMADTAYLNRLPIPMASITSNIEETLNLIVEVQEHLGLSPEQLSRIDSLII